MATPAAGRRRGASFVILAHACHCQTQQCELAWKSLAEDTDDCSGKQLVTLFLDVEETRRGPSGRREERPPYLTCNENMPVKCQLTVQKIVGVCHKECKNEEWIVRACEKAKSCLDEIQKSKEEDEKEESNLHGDLGWLCISVACAACLFVMIIVAWDIIQSAFQARRLDQHRRNGTIFTGKLSKLSKVSSGRLPGPCATRYLVLDLMYVFLRQPSGTYHRVNVEEIEISRSTYNRLERLENDRNEVIPWNEVMVNVVPGIHERCCMLQMDVHTRRGRAFCLLKAMEWCLGMLAAVLGGFVLASRAFTRDVSGLTVYLSICASLASYILLSLFLALHLKKLQAQESFLPRGTTTLIDAAEFTAFSNPAQGRTQVLTQVAPEADATPSMDRRTQVPTQVALEVDATPSTDRMAFLSTCDKHAVDAPDWWIRD